MMNEDHPYHHPDRMATKTGRRTRPTYSCLNCHKRKVKCDRVKPCGACCLRGDPAGCEYAFSPQSRHYIEQDALIYKLWRSCGSLQQQLAEARSMVNLLGGKDQAIFAPTQLELASTSTDAPDQNQLFEMLMNHGSSPGPSLLADPAPLAQPNRSLTAHASANMLVEIFLERLIDSFAPPSAVTSGSVVEWRNAAKMQAASPLLSRAFPAAALTLAGFRDQNQSLQMAGQVRYVRVLRSLQVALHSQAGSLSTAALIVVVLFTIIEAFKQTSPGSIYRHQLGGLQLLQLRTPYRHRYGVERSLFVDLRMYWVTAALVHRKPTFLSSQEWLTVPWSGDAPPKDILQQLLDIAVDIPAYLAQVDEFSTSLGEGTTPPTRLKALRFAIEENAMQLERRLQRWKSTSVDQLSPGPPCEELQADSDDNFPIFRCQRSGKKEVFTPTVFVFPDLLLAMSLCFFWAMRLILSAEPGVARFVSLQERYQLASNICRSMRYYVRNIPGCLVSRLMFVLRVAFDTFADGMVEKEFLAGLFVYIGNQFRFPVFLNKCVSSDAGIKGNPDGTE